ncbi:MAG TPA: hypothetical protein VGI64_07695 [Streptosporangiaceae bacterium]
MAPECQEKNARGLTMVAIGMNKSAEEFLILDEDTRRDLASGKYRDQRRGSFGTSPAAPAGPAASPATRQLPGRPRPAGAQQDNAVPAAGQGGDDQRNGSRDSGPARASRRARPAPAPRAARPAWTRSQERLALLYNEQGLRPAEIAAKLGVSPHLATQIILAARNRGKA